MIKRGCCSPFIIDLGNILPDIALDFDVTSMFLSESGSFCALSIITDKGL